MKKNKLILVKIGGSCISDKSIPKSLHENVIDNICSQIKRAGRDVLLVHGGGSFGHPLAKTYKINEGRLQSVENQATGFTMTHTAMIELNTIVVKKFIAHGMDAYPVQPSAIYINKNGFIHDGWVRSIDALIEEGFVPVLHGDTVVDVSRGWGILSGDAIMVHLANNLSHDVDKLVYLLDVDGLHDKDPKIYQDARLIQDVLIENGNITIKGFKDIDHGPVVSTTAGGVIDVTGGIMRKLGELARIERQGIEAFFLNGRDPSRLAHILTSTIPRCTKITIHPPA